MKTRLIFWVFAGALLVFFLSCGQQDRGLISRMDRSSHKAGSDCGSCHYKGGEATKALFTLAGTLYDQTREATYAGGTVEFYTGPNGSGNLVARLTTDSLGNFYTTEAVDFGTGLYVKAIGKEGSAQFKMTATTIGNCNSCHGQRTAPVWTR